MVSEWTAASTLGSSPRADITARVNDCRPQPSEITLKVSVMIEVSPVGDGGHDKWGSRRQTGGTCIRSPDSGPEHEHRPEDIPILHRNLRPWHHVLGRTWR